MSHQGVPGKLSNNTCDTLALITEKPAIPAIMYAISVPRPVEYLSREACGARGQGAKLGLVD